MESKTSTFRIEVTRNLSTDDPKMVMQYALRQAQAEDAMNEVKLANGLSGDDANFYYRHADGFADLILWASDEDVIGEVTDILEGRYFFDELEVEELPRGEA